MKLAPEQYRLKSHKLLGSDASYGNNGFFVIPHHRIHNYFYSCQISDGQGWEHVSVTLTLIDRKRHLPVKRCPTWEEMCFIKDIFWSEDECVIQYHPPKSEYISLHPYCLHLWKSTINDIAIPDTIFIGPKSALKL